MLDPKLREEIIKKIKELKQQQLSLRLMQDCIFNTFNVLLSLKTISCYVHEAYKDEWLKEMKRQNDIVHDWLAKAEPEKIVSEAENMAEAIYQAVKNKDNTLFSELFESMSK